MTHSTRDSIYGPLYPVAEWIVSNWWSLLNETPTPGRLQCRGYQRRHDLASAGEGFALPSLQFHPEGQRVLLKWQRRVLPHYHLSFLSDGFRYLDRGVVKEELSRFVSIVVARLQERGVENTFLADEWEAIQQADEKERAFCEAAGRLGWDPYDLAENDAKLLVEIANSFPSGVLHEFLNTAEPTALAAQSHALVRFVDLAAKVESALDSVRQLRDKRLPLESHPTPWEQGYDYARRLRTLLDREDSRIRSLRDVGHFFESRATNHLTCK